ncbi:MAG: aspartate--ammonia ligase [Clostridia bacterium]|nr:aspartate--ammonia ligase [Clostridia bacterium]
MSKVMIPAGYRPALSLYDTQKAIGLIKRLFEDMLCGALNLRRVSSPLFVPSDSGLNDNLNGVERPVKFDVKDTGADAEVVHSLAKWKRQALRDYGFGEDTGLYADMNAIRRDEELDNIHSIYVDQWDWEKIIAEEDRTKEYLQAVVRKIVDAICDTEQTLRVMFPQLQARPALCREVYCITTQELEDRYPDLTPKERENAIAKEYKTVLLMEIGGVLRSGKKHDGRAPDYDDWALNGDILFWNETLQQAFEISSMGIRVSPESLARQLKIADCEDRKDLPFHKALLAGELPLTIGGGIGQSRLCMLMLGSAHIGEVQASIWDEKTLNSCREAGIPIL